jgi:hypothetical protein
MNPTAPYPKSPSTVDISLRSTVLRLIVIAVLSLLVSFGAPGADATESITRFSSDITINGDSSLSVTELIEVVAEGRDIRRGIYRDLPTTYEDRFGNRIAVIYEVLKVHRDGEAEPYRLESLSNGIRIRIGQADRFLSTGPHSYQIVYRTERQLGFFDSFDELYWNVTGNGWGFPIRKATASVRLPAGATAVQKAAYTGAFGAQGSDYLSAESNGIWTFATTRELAPGEGLTIAIGWPKGFVQEPTGGDLLSWFIDDNLATGLAIASTVLIFWYYFIAWRRFGKDPEHGTIFPRFKPPAGLSPAATRFIRLMSFDKKAFSAALINMAVKGYLTIEEADGDYSLVKAEDADFESLANGERRAAKRIFSAGNSIELDNKNHEVLGKSVSNLRESLKVEYERAYFKHNTGLFFIGVASSVVLIIFSGSLGNDPGLFVRAMIQAGVAGVIVFIVLHFWGDDSDPTFKAVPFKSVNTRALTVTVLNIIIFGTIIAIQSMAALSISLFSNAIQSICFAMIGGLNVIFFFLMKKPTLAGRSIMDEIEGFRQYLSVAEEARLNKLNPPEKTPELFERYLPYALALDVENEWSERFARILTLASMSPSENGYHPRWYRGSSWKPGTTNSFSRNLSSSLGAAVASSVTAPGSSSGSGGGGFSGGGGGGGGGGGW